MIPVPRLSTQHSTTHQTGIGLYRDHTGHEALSAQIADLNVR